MQQREYCTFAEFYPFYLSQHTNPMCRRLHFIGLVLSLVAFAGVVAAETWLCLVFVPWIGYAFGWTGHFFFEKNAPASLRYPVYSFLGDFAMARDILLGRIKV